MNRTRLVLRNLFFHWRGNLPVLLGVAVGAAVLTGALLVGDSLRGSLRDRTERQLGWVESALVGGRFVRAEVAEKLPGRVAPAVLLQGSVRNASAADEFEHTARKVTVLGVDRRFGIDSPRLDGRESAAVLSAPLAQALGVKAGDSVLVGVQQPSAIPRSSVLGRRGFAEATSTFRLKVAEVLPPGHPANDFNLSPGPGTPLNLFVPLRRLQDEVKQPDRANAFLAAGAAPEDLQAQLRANLTLEDWGLRVFIPPKRPVYISLESRQLLLEPAAVEAGFQSARETGLRMGPTMVYLANDISLGQRRGLTREGGQALAAGTGLFLASPTGHRLLFQAFENRVLSRRFPYSEGRALVAGPALFPPPDIPYSVVAALDPTKPPPLGPFLPPGVSRMGDRDIILVDWPGLPVRPQAGDPVSVTYFKPEIEGRIEEAIATFTFRGLVPLPGPADAAVAGAAVRVPFPADDPDLTPEFPGITDKLTQADWDPPFPYHGNRVHKRDELFWEQHRATPKAYVTLRTGEALWGSRFGALTSLRFAPEDGRDLNQALAELRGKLLGHLDPERGGLRFDAVRQRLLAAGQGSTDFGGLFLGFSFFLIAAALLLVGLLFRLNLDRRAAEVGLLLAAGYRVRTVRRMLLAEGMVLAVIGGLIGLAGAAGYAVLMLRLLADLWPTQSVGSFLAFHATPLSFAVGYAAALLMSGLTILWALRLLSRIAPSALLAGETAPPPDPTKQPAGAYWSVLVAVVALAAAVGLGVWGRKLPAGEARAGTFFGAGALLLTGGLALVWVWMKRRRRGEIHGHGAAALARLGTRNAARNPTRSLLTAALLASAAFLLVAVESFRRQPEHDFLDRSGGSGGFALVAESDVPVYQDLNGPEGREEIAEGLQRYFQERARREKGGPPVRERVAEAERVLQSATVYPFRLRAGDDASCLNLYQATRPRVLGVPQALIRRGGFQFAETEAKTPEQQKNPWLLLDARSQDGSVPVFVENNTAVWMLKKGLGDELEVPDEEGRPVKMRIVGLLRDSVFQSEVLMSDAAFRQHFPRMEGFSYFLIDVQPPSEAPQVAKLLEAGLDAQGFDVTPTRQRLAAYLAVQNTYLTTFQLLGGFGLLLGVLGLAVVLLRSVWERRGELALLRAVGYRERSLTGLVLAENALLLILGLGAGVGAALAAVAPHLAEGGSVPWLRLAGMLGLVLCVGLAVALLATRSTLRAPLIPALRKE